jgi:adenylate cyclase
MIAHEVADAIPYEKNPVQRVCYGRETLRRRLDLPNDELDFEVLIELRERGGTDYIALPIDGVYAAAYMLTFVTDRPHGFSEDELADLARVGRRLSITADRHNQWWITHNLLCAYLGANTGPKVLTGQIRRGTGMALTAVLRSSDLRGFTERSDRLPSERMIAILNALFEAQAAEIRGHGGEILKFIGDGLLAIFPIGVNAVAAVAKTAVAAARNAIAAVARLADHPAMDGEPPLDIVVALHVGTVHYGNVGAADRLDFTVIGPAVNLVSRIENAAKMLGHRSSSVHNWLRRSTASCRSVAISCAVLPHRRSCSPRTEQPLQPGSIREPPLLVEALDVSRADACSCPNPGNTRRSRSEQPVRQRNGRDFISSCRRSR